MSSRYEDIYKDYLLGIKPIDKFFIKNFNGLVGLIQTKGLGKLDFEEFRDSALAKVFFHKDNFEADKGTALTFIYTVVRNEGTRLAHHEKKLENGCGLLESDKVCAFTGNILDRISRDVGIRENIFDFHKHARSLGINYNIQKMYVSLFRDEETPLTKVFNWYVLKRGGGIERYLYKG